MPDMRNRLYAISCVAVRPGVTQQEIGVQTILFAADERTNIGLAGNAIARDLFPTRDHWKDHHVNVLEVSQGFVLDELKLKWELARK